MALLRRQTEEPAPAHAPTREELSGARQRIAQLEAELAQSTNKDPLTGALLSLRAFRTQLELDVKRALRYRRPLSVIALDIDGFRKINLKYGYPAGDAVLVTVAEILNAATRIHDLACRMAGDEFVILLPETDAEAAIGAAERLQAELEDLVAGPVRGLGASIGIAELEPGQSTEQLLAAAAKAVDQARVMGGARMSIYRSTDGAENTLEADPGHGDVIAALASALQERDRYTGDHSESVVEVAAKVGQSLAMDEGELARLRTAALLHDIGKVGVPDHILHKAGRLDPDEWEVMREHPIIGERILRAIPGLGAVAKIVRHEHERWDGKGYPDGISGETIPLGARIILACDAYHAMTSDRPYRSAMPREDAIVEVMKNAGTQFDPDITEALIGYLYSVQQTGAVGP